MPTKSRTIFTSLWLTVVVFLCSLFYSHPAQAATLSLSPATGNYTTQNNFTVSIEVNTNQSINGVEGSLKFPTDKLEVISLDKSKSVMSMWIQEPNFSNGGAVGLVQFSAIKLNPGFVGSKGNVLNVVFRVKDAGVANIAFASGAILANDGKGSNLLDAFGSAVFSFVKGSYLPSTPTTPAPGSTVLVPAKYSPNSFPQIKHWIQDSTGKDILFNTSDNAPKWTNSSYAKLTWSVPEETTGVISLFNNDPDTELGTITNSIANSQVLPFLSEGRHYFHLRFIGSGGAGPTLHFPVLVDLHEPKHFSINFDGEETTGSAWHTTSNPRPRLNFFTSDELSGLDHYEFKINNGDWNVAKLEFDGTFIMPKLETQIRYDLVIRAFDLSGNFTDAPSALSVQPIVAPAITYYPRNIWSINGPLTIEGKSAPEAKIEVMLGKKEPLLISAKADTNGDWRVVYTGVLPAGTYTVKIRQILDNGAESVWSPDFTIRVDSWLAKLIMLLEKFFWYVIIILFILVQTVILLYYRRAFKRALARSYEQPEETEAVSPTSSLQK